MFIFKFPPHRSYPRHHHSFPPHSPLSYYTSTSLFHATLILPRHHSFFYVTTYFFTSSIIFAPHHSYPCHLLFVPHKSFSTSPLSNLLHITRMHFTTHFHLTTHFHFTTHFTSPLISTPSNIFTSPLSSVPTRLKLERKLESRSVCTDGKKVKKFFYIYRSEIWH